MSVFALVQRCPCLRLQSTYRGHLARRYTLSLSLSLSPSLGTLSLSRARSFDRICQGFVQS
jgi:hypothetical protein